MEIPQWNLIIFMLFIIFIDIVYITSIIFYFISIPDNGKKTLFCTKSCSMQRSQIGSWEFLPVTRPVIYYCKAGHSDL